MLCRQSEQVGRVSQPLCEALEQPAILGVEKRRLKRYRLQVPVELRWKNVSGWREQAALMRNMNTHSISVQCPEQLAPGVSVRVQCLLRRSAAPPDLQLAGSGTVLRCDPMEDGGYAIVVQAKTPFKLGRVGAIGQSGNSAA
jgi:hypothetical protein